MCSFGEEIRGIRLAELGVSMREFCVSNGIDTVEWSKLERGVNRPPAPGSPVMLRICAVLGCEGGIKRDRILRIAQEDLGKWPEGLADRFKMSHLPIFLPPTANHLAVAEMVMESDRETPPEEVSYFK